jgi:hypothetical protein
MDPVFTIILGFLEKGGPWALSAVLLGMLFSFVRSNDTSARQAIVAQNEIVKSILLVITDVKECLVKIDDRNSDIRTTQLDIQRSVNDSLDMLKVRKGRE